MTKHNIECVRMNKIENIRNIRNEMRSSLNSEELCMIFRFGDMDVELHMEKDDDGIFVDEWGDIRISGDEYWWKNEVGLWGDQVGKKGCPSISDPNYPDHRPECKLDQEDKRNILKIRDKIGLGTRYVFPKLKVKEY